MPRKPKLAPGTVRIVLHGRLRREFGPEYQFGVSTVAAGVNALITLVPGFRAALNEGQYRVRRGSYRAGVDLQPAALALRLPPGGEMHIIPVAAGAKQGGVGKIILGTVLVVAAVALMQPELGLVAADATFGAAMATPLLGGLTTIGGLALAGGAMILGGISQMISPQTKAASSAQATNSFMLSGQANTADQGVPVPVVYGRTLVGSVVVSIGYSAEDYDTTAQTLVAETSGSVTGVGSSGSTTATGQGGGGGGKGGGGSNTPNISPDTLRSNATVRILDVLSEGPIGGFVNGLKSVYFNNTPLMADDGSYNFQGVTCQLMVGTPDQWPVPGFPAAEESQVVNVQVKQANPVIRTIVSTSATAARVTIEIPQLFEANSSTGDVNPAPPLNYVIDVRPSQGGSPGWVGGWTTVANVTISGGKCSSPYQRSHRFDLPGRDQQANTWDIRLTRVTADSALQQLQNDLYWALLDTITDHQLIYPNIAYVAFTFDARAFGSSIPTRSYEIWGRQIMVPYNYYEPDRTYATSGPGTSGGTWDLVTMKPGYQTGQPAWVLLDLLSHTRYGCGIPDKYLEVAKAQLYNIAQYCDGMVPDGFGGTMPRYDVNAVISTQDDAYRVLQTVVSAFRGMTYWGAGAVQVSADMPSLPVKLVNQANVIDGQFDYQGTSHSTRHNLVRVTYLDRDYQYRVAVEPVMDGLDIAIRGVVSTDYVAWGCTSRSLAHRLGKWIMFTENLNTDVVNYSAGLYHLDARPGEVISLSDPAYIGLRMAGRLRADSTVSVLHLDTVFAWSTGNTYTVSVVMPDGTVDADIAITGFANAGANPDYTLASLARPLAMTPTTNAEYIITSSAVQPRQFKIIGMQETSRGVFAVSAAMYDPNKFAEVELGLKFDPTPYSLLPALLVAAIPPPTNVSARDYFTGVGITQIIRVTVSWTAPLDPRIDGFQVSTSADSFQQILSTTNGASVDIDGLPVGATYTFGVRSIGRDGKTSSWALSEAILIDGQADPPVAPSGLTATGGTRRVQLNWLQIAGRRDIIQYEIWRASIPGAAPGTGATFLATSGGTSYLDAQSDILRPHTTWYYWVRGMALGASLVPGAFAGPAAATTTLLIVDDLADGIINTAKFAQGIIPTLVTGVPSGAPAAGKSPMQFNELDGQLYTWNGHAWTSIAQEVASGTTAIPAANIIGALTNSQIADLNAAKLTGSVTVATVPAVKVTGTLTDAQIASLAATKISGTLSDAQLASISAAKVSGQLTDAQIQAIASTKLVGALTSDQIAALDAAKLTGSMTNATVPALKIAGTLTSDQIAALDAAKLTGTITTATVPAIRVSGQLTDAQIAAVAAAKLTGTISATQIADGAISTPKLAAGSVTAAQIAADTITASQIAAGAITASEIAAGAVTANAIAANSISTGMLQANSVTTAQLAANSVTANQLAASSVIAGKIAADSITANEIAANAITANELAANAVTAGKIAANTITATELAAGSVTTAKLVAGAVTANEIAANTITAANIAADTITAGQIAASAITANELAANAVTAGKISAGAITATEIAADTITAANIAANAITASELAAGSVTTAKLVAGAVTANEIAAQTITAANIASDTITANQIAASAITANELAANAVTAGKVAANTITANELAAGSVIAGKIAASAVTTETLAVGSPGNMCWNPNLEISGDGWTCGGPTLIYGNTSFGTGWAPTWRIAGVGSGAIRCGALALNSSAYAIWTPDLPSSGLSAACKAGDVFEVQAQLLPLTYAARVVLDFFDVTQTVGLGTLVGQRIPPSTSTYGNALVYYQRSWVVGTAPANAAFVRAYVQVFNDGGAGIPPGPAEGYLFWCNFSIGPGVPNATSPQAFSPGGVSSISGAMIKSRSMAADRMFANSITANELAAGSVVAGKIAANAITVGTVAAAAIGASEIAAGQIRSTHLAADFVLAYSAQIGTAVIGTAQIGDLQVATQKIANSAVTNLAAASGGAVQNVTLWIYSDGSPVVLWFAISLTSFLIGDTAHSPVYGIARDGNLIAYNSIMLIDFPGAGTHSYQVSVYYPPEVYGWGVPYPDGGLTNSMYVIAETIKK